MVAALRCAVLLLAPFLGHAQKFYTYVGRIGTDSVLLAWGTTGGSGNTIGRISTSHGKAEVKIGDRVASSDENWVVVCGLRPDTEYPYEVVLGGKRIAASKVRTYPERSTKLAFFVIGDWGTGKPPQYQVAAAMWAEFEKRSGSDNPVRFVLTTGDNLYGDRILGIFLTRSGDADRHWGPKFFEPYERLLARVPFHPSLGNHDGEESEARGDLRVYLDNFFFPAEPPARYYRFSFGGLAEFFALDSTDNRLDDSTLPVYSEAGPQFRWLRDSLAASRAAWKIPYFHHPPFNAGPRHGASLDSLRHFVDLFRRTGVKAVFNGHEHNFQFSKQDSGSGGIRFVVSGAGGELRTKDVSSKMEKAGIAGWAPQRHFLLVEIEERTMKITPLGPERVIVTDKDRQQIKMPLEVSLP